MRKLGTVLASVALAIGMIFFGSYVGPTNPMRKAQAQTTVAKPNIIFVLTDDQFPGTENAMPDLKANVTSEGVKFTNMTSTFPLCCPGRATILRGQYAHNTKIYGNSLPLGGWEQVQDAGGAKQHHRHLVARRRVSHRPVWQILEQLHRPGIPPGWDRWYAWNGPYEGWTSLNDQGTREAPAPQGCRSPV